MENLILGMRYPNISQGCNAYIPEDDRWSTTASHRNYNAIDIRGMDTGSDGWRAKNHVKCIAAYPVSTTGFYNTVFFTPCDVYGNPVKVMTACHGAQFVTFKMTHDTRIRINVGQIYSGDQIIYMEGTTGGVPNHVHLEACLGITTKITKVTGSQYSRGRQFILEDGLPLNELFFCLKGYTQFEPTDNKHYPWKWVDSIECKEEVPVITKDEKTGVYGVDLSQYDKSSINFEKLAKTAKYAILRVGFGKDLDGQHDSAFKDFCTQCDKYGIKKGAYIYSYAETETEARNEACHIIRLCDEAGGDFPIGLFLDMEDRLQTKLSATVNTRNVLAYIDEIWKTNYKAGFYSYHGFMDQYVDMSQIVGNAVVWVADFGVNDGTYHSIETSFDYDIRQYTSINSDKDFSSRDQLDQNLHFGYSNYVREPVEEDPDHDVSQVVEDVDAMRHAVANLQNQLEILNKQVEALQLENATQDLSIENLEGRLSVAGNALLGKEE